MIRALAILVAFLAAITLAVGAPGEPRAAGFVWLSAWFWAVSIGIGVQVLVLMGDVAPIRWLRALRPALVEVANVMPWIALLFLPLAFSVRSVWAWADPGALPEELRALAEHRWPWLNPTSFLIRSAICLVFWSWLASALRGVHGRGWSGAMLCAIGLTWTSASFDWVMSLDVAWKSPIFGILTWAGGFVAAIALTVLVALSLERSERLPELPPDVYHALGRMLLAFVVFWAYVSFAQLLIVWIGDLPSEIPWYLPRLRGWSAWLTLLAIGHFALPFLLLLSRPLKRTRRALGAVAAWLLVMHWVDVRFLVMPALDPDGPVWRPTELAALIAVAALLFALLPRRIEAARLVVLPDTFAYKSR